MSAETLRANGQESILPISITDHILNEQRHHPEATGALTSIMLGLARVARRISKTAREAESSGAYGLTGEINVQGEKVIKLDKQANDLFKEVMSKDPHVAGFASEEETTFVPFKPDPKRKYVLWFDPLDGSSNFDTSVTIGSIFSIYQRVSSVEESVNEADFLQKGREQVGAGYFVFGFDTKLVYTTGNGVFNFNLDSSGEFVLSKELPQIVTPEESMYYSVNEAYSPQWFPHVVAFVEMLKTMPEKPCSARYAGSLVTDFHRNLLKGGVYLYLSDKKHPEGKLRLNCELNPLAFIAEQAGGRATNGEMDILDIQPTSLHQRSPVVIGSKNEVNAFLKSK